jgi:hypothetical protein
LWHVSEKEVLLSKDFFKQAVAKLEGLELNSSFLGLLLPGKCLIHSFEALSNGVVIDIEHIVMEATGITHFADPTEDNLLMREPQSKQSNILAEENDEKKGKSIKG